MTKKTVKAFVSIEDFVSNLNLLEGDNILLSSDIRKLAYTYFYSLKKNNNDKEIDFSFESFMDKLIDCIKDSIGAKGTLAIPTYNWDFCKGIAFDIRKTPCKTGSLGSKALAREDFKRTKHPIYSFAITGLLQEEFVSLDNKDSFDLSSPFALFHKYGFKNIIIDVSLQYSFTFVHYVEEGTGVVTYRFIKNFNADYVDEKGVTTNRTYSMFVRDYSRDVINTLNPLAPKFEVADAIDYLNYDVSKVMIVDLQKAYNVIREDVLHNDSACICNHN